jgi:hypothetical protein
MSIFGVGTMSRMGGVSAAGRGDTKISRLAGSMTALLLR